MLRIKIELDKTISEFEQQRRMERVFILLLEDAKNKYVKRDVKLQATLDRKHE